MTWRGPWNSRREISLPRTPGPGWRGQIRYSLQDKGNPLVG
jgi:hypothetical protein